MPPTITRLSDRPDVYVADMRDVLDEACRDLTHLGLTPVTISATFDYRSSFEVSVQFSGEDTASVDLLAQFYGLPAEGDEPYAVGNYTRRGPVVLGNDAHVIAHVFTGAEVTA